MRWNIRPSKPVAVFGTLVGVGILAFGIASMHKLTPFLVFWCAVGVGVIAFNLWAAFASGGRSYSAETSGEEPPRGAGHSAGNRWWRRAAWARARGSSQPLTGL